MNIITWTPEELAVIRQHGEVCIETAKNAMVRCGINFNQIERINDHYEDHTWGSEADRRYRMRAVNKAVQAVAKAPLRYTDKAQLQEVPA